VVPPLSVRYRDYFVHGQPPPSQGMILLEELRIAEGTDLASLSEADRIHLMVEAKKLAFADRYRILGDPEHVDVNVADILGDSHIAKRRAEIDLDKANNQPVSHNQEGSDTTYFLVADRDGNALSWIQSVFHGFGASWAIPGISSRLESGRHIRSMLGQLQIKMALLPMSVELQGLTFKYRQISKLSLMPSI